MRFKCYFFECEKEYKYIGERLSKTCVQFNLNKLCHIEEQYNLPRYNLTNIFNPENVKWACGMEQDVYY